MRSPAIQLTIIALIVSCMCAEAQQLRADPSGVSGENTGSAYVKWWSRILVEDSTPVNPAANPSAYIITGTTITVEAWIFPTKPPGPDGFQIIAGRPMVGAFPGYAYELRIDNTRGGDDPRLEFRISNGDTSSPGAVATDINHLHPGNWIHVAGMYDGIAVHLYENGVLAAQTPYSQPVGPGNTGFFIGGRDGDSFQGIIDEVRLWGTARSQPDIQGMMDSVLNGHEPGLAGYWPLDTDTTVNGFFPATIDKTLNRNDLRVQGDIEFLRILPHGVVRLLPELEVVALLPGVVGQLFQYWPVVIGWPPPVLGMVSGPAGLTYDGGSNRVLWTPAATQWGYQNFVLSATNDTGSTQATFHVWVDVFPPGFLELHNNNITATLWNNGLIGRDSSDEGFTFLGKNGLYEGRPVVAQSIDRVSGGLYTAEFANKSPVEFTTSGFPGFDQAVKTRLSDARSPDPIGIELNERVHSKSSDPDRNYILMEYYIVNPSDTALTGIYGGQMMDWDIGNYWDNYAGYDGARGLVYMYAGEGSGNTYYYGMMPLNRPLSGFGFWKGYPTLDDKEDSVLYRRMSTLGGVPGGSGDYRAICGVGPFDIPPHDSARVLFAFVCGTASGDLFANADTARRIMTGSVVGSMFNDLNGNGIRDSSDTSLAGWPVKLVDAQNAVSDSCVTNSFGNYAFTTVGAGSYTLREDPLSGWLQTFPKGTGEYPLAVAGGSHITGKDFGNIHGYQYTGPSAGHWSDSANWSGMHVPYGGSSVVVPQGVQVVVDALPRDSIRALRVEPGGNLSFSASAGQLKVAGSLHIDQNAVVEFPGGGGSSGISCYGDWVSRGTLSPGRSTIFFTGPQNKTIAWIPPEGDGEDASSGKKPNGAASNTFYSVELSGGNVSLVGNMRVKNRLSLLTPLVPRDQDTVFIDTSVTNAIQGPEKIIRGAVRRMISPGETGTYRFESPDTYVRFYPTGTNPIALSMIAFPDTQLRAFSLGWQTVNSTVDSVRNILTADSVKRFSKWTLGIPKPTKDGTVKAHRAYSITAEGGVSFAAQLSLRYDASEISGSEADLQLLRGPFIHESVTGRWNMVSLPLVPEVANLDSLFPGASSSAFAFDNMYIPVTQLEFGRGYWIKYPVSRQVTIFGDDRSDAQVPVHAGWNLIGAISYPMSALSASSAPPGLIVSQFFGYTASYFPADSLFPMHAYWVKSSGVGALLLSSNPAMLKTTDTSPLRKLNAITVRDRTEAEQQLYFGRVSEKVALTYELPPLPPQGVFDVRFSTGRMVETAGEDTARDIPVQLSSAQYPVTLRWTIKDPSVLAWLAIGKREVLLNTDGSTDICDSILTPRIRFVQGPRSEVPKEYALHQNYPNPFNPSTMIVYELPVASRVRLTVYNILGQEVGSLVDGIQEAGRKTIEWNAPSRRGTASGIYFYRLNASAVFDPGIKFSQVKKMVLVR